MKIRIYGSSGSGKTYLSSKLSKELAYPVMHLDDVFYDQSQKPLFSVRRDEDESLNVIADFIKQDDWIVDGGWYSLEKQSYDDADILVYLMVPLYTRVWRIFKRYIRRKRAGLDDSFTGTMNLLWYVITHNKKFTVTRPKIFRDKYEDKLYFFTSADQAFTFLTEKYLHQ